MKNLLSFNEYVNENYNIEEAKTSNFDAEGFDPIKDNPTDPTKAPVKAKAGKPDAKPGFEPAQNPDKKSGKIDSISNMTPGKEYFLTIDGKKHGDMIYQGYSDGVHIFNGEDKAHDVSLTDSQLTSVISAGGAVEVDE
jgi:hypothetical protein